MALLFSQDYRGGEICQSRIADSSIAEPNRGGPIQDLIDTLRQRFGRVSSLIHQCPPQADSPSTPTAASNTGTAQPTHPTPAFSRTKTDLYSPDFVRENERRVTYSGFPTDPGLERESAGSGEEACRYVPHLRRSPSGA